LSRYTAVYLQQTGAYSIAAAPDTDLLLQRWSELLAAAADE
jgi:hypothetical protein